MWCVNRHLGKINRTFLAPQFHFPPLGALVRWHAWRRLVAKVGTSNQDRTISLKAAVRSCINKGHFMALLPISKMIPFHTNRTKDILHALQIKPYYVAEFVCPHLIYWLFTEPKRANLQICDEMSQMFKRNLWSLMVNSLVPSGSW
jgi:hypothetical protein